MKVILVGKIHPEAEKLLSEHFDYQHLDNEQFYQREDFSGIQAIALRTFTNLKKEHLDKMPDLKFVVNCSVGFDNLDLDEIEERGIKLVSCSGTNSNSVAEHTIYLLWSLLREDPREFFSELKGKTIGIIGFGNIGKLVAKKLLGSQAKVIAYDVVEQDREVLAELKTEIVSLENLCKDADIITVHVPLNKHTAGLVNRECFENMKEDVFFINTSRSELLDEEALIDKYQRQGFRGLAFDVYSENLKKNLKAGHVIFTDHVGARGEESFRNMCIEPMKKFLSILEK